jgi:hypothetical protein
VTSGSHMKDQVADYKAAVCVLALSKV